MGERVQNLHRKINTGQKPNRPYSPSSSWRIVDIYFSHTYHSYVKSFVLNINSSTSTCMCARCVFKYISVPWILKERYTVPISFPNKTQWPHARDKYNDIVILMILYMTWWRNLQNCKIPLRISGYCTPTRVSYTV